LKLRQNNKCHINKRALGAAAKGPHFNVSVNILNLKYKIYGNFGLIHHWKVPKALIAIIMLDKQS
jgi:hypothetical protein